jgi:hypothetical protein
VSRHTIKLAIVSNVLAAVLAGYSMVGPPQLVEQKVVVDRTAEVRHHGWDIIYGGDAYYGKTKAEQGMD